MNKFPPMAMAIALVAVSSQFAIAGEPRPHTDKNPGLKCIATTEKQTVRDATNYPGAYESGYQQGNSDRLKNSGFQPPTNVGELARGYNNGYQLQPYIGQTTTVPTENRVTCGCRTRILKDIVFTEEVEATCRSERQESTAIWQNDGYNATAYVDGYREGLESKSKRETYQIRSAGGEFARGFEDGFFGRKSTGQRYTAVPVKDYQCKCRLVIKRQNLDAEY
jgi:hypothetical protein